MFRQARLMGHSSVETTRGYTEVKSTDALEPLDRLAGHRLQNIPRHRRNPPREATS